MHPLAACCAATRRRSGIAAVDAADFLRRLGRRDRRCRWSPGAHLRRAAGAQRRLLQQIMQTIAFYTIAAIGLNVLVGYQGQVSLGHGALFAFGAYASALLTTRLVCRSGSPSSPRRLIAGLIGSPGRPADAARQRGHYLAMVTIALGDRHLRRRSDLDRRDQRANRASATSRGPSGSAASHGLAETIPALRRRRSFASPAQVLYFWVVRRRCR